MNLTAAGLNKTEATIYESLLKRKEWKPAELAKNVGETRTNMYKILDKLTAVGLAKKFDKNNKIHYRATNPTQLIQLSQNLRSERAQQEKELELAAQQLLNSYIKIHEQPGIRFFIGKEQIGEVYEDQVQDANPIYFMLSPKAIDFYGFERMHSLRMLAVNAGIPRYAITPDNLRVPANYIESDKKALLTRTWLAQQDYTAPLEWGVYGNKVYFVTFGEDALGMIIESEAMAKGFMQMYNIIESGQKAKSSYSKLPKLPKSNKK